MRFRLLVLLLALSVVLSGCGLFGGDDEPTPTPQPAAEPTATPAPTATPEPTATPTPPAELSWEDVVDLMKPSTVRVLSDFPSTALEFEFRGGGTGIVYTDDGYIITNAHVVSGAAAVTITEAGSTRERSARVVGISDCDDIAILKIDDMDGLTAAKLGSSREQRVGAEVAALGYPMGAVIGNELSFSRGVISKLNEPLLHFESLIQHDAAINPGNSGGPLVNRKGEVVGINSLGFDPSVATNINFAISIDQAKPIIEQLQAGTNRLYLGMNLEINYYGDYFGTDAGLVVSAVGSGSPASKIGVRAPYLLTHLQGLSVNYMEDVCRILRSHQDGDALKVELLHITPTEVQYLEGEVVLGDPDRGTDLQVVYRESYGNSTAPGGEGGSLTVGWWAGTAEIFIDYWAPCGQGGEWIIYDSLDLSSTAYLIVDGPYQGEDNPYYLEIWIDPFDEEGAFNIVSSVQLSTSQGEQILQYWSLGYDGYEIWGELVETGAAIDQIANVLMTWEWDDPCAGAGGMLFQPEVMSVGTTIEGNIGPDNAILLITGTSDSGLRDFGIALILDPVD